MGYVAFWSFMITFIVGITVAVIIGMYEGRKERKAELRDDEEV